VSPEAAPKPLRHTELGVPKSVFDSAIAEMDALGASRESLLRYFRQQKEKLGEEFNPINPNAWVSLKGFKEWFKG